MFLISFWRTLKFAFQNFFRNFWLSLATITIIVLTLLSVNTITMIQILTQRAISEVEGKIDLTIHFVPRASQTDIEKTRKIFEELPLVSEVHFVSSEGAFTEFKQKHEGDSTIERALSQLEENPLGASLTLRAKNLRDYNELVTILETSEEISQKAILTKDFRDYQKLVERIELITARTTQVGFAVSLLFMIITILIVFNTIRVAIYTHREEIAVMKLVGASNIFVRAPFLLETLWLSVLSFVISLLIWLPILGVLEPYLGDFFSGNFEISQFLLENFFTVFGYQFLLLVLINMLSATVAVGKYLRV